MTNKNDNYNSYSLDFFGKECKNNYHKQCSGQWQGLGFKVYCNCECHRKLVLDKAILKNDSNNENNIIVELNNKSESNK